MPMEEILRENKRECFDGMRAYHRSEIDHANHAIKMLLALAAATGAVVVAILFPESRLANNVREIAWSLFAVVSALGSVITWVAHKKISEDHDKYASFGAEYVKTSERLGLYANSYVTLNDGQSIVQPPIKTNKNIGQGTGYRETQRIILCFAAMLIVLTFLFAVFICFT